MAAPGAGSSVAILPGDRADQLYALALGRLLPLCRRWQNLSHEQRGREGVARCGLRQEVVALRRVRRAHVTILLDLTLRIIGPASSPGTTHWSCKLFA